MSPGAGNPSEMNPRETPLRADDPAVQEILDRLSGLELPMSAEHRANTSGAVVTAVGDDSPLVAPIPRLTAFAATPLARAAAVGLVVLLTLSGLAVAQALPTPIQHAAERIAAIAGLDISKPETPEPAAEVSQTTLAGRSTTPAPSTPKTRAPASTEPRTDFECDDDDASSNDSDDEPDGETTVTTTDCPDGPATTPTTADDESDDEERR